ncbi:MAG TPA: 4-alpha-glucanotransferase [Polyangiaceae bacterium]|nr:4-alpha-glucanotransferase [Polyangiaceae bacterium]
MDRIDNATRTSGVILHPTSLPGSHGIGQLGEHARGFIDFLARAEIGLWQVLPVVPVQEDWFSPYSGLSAFGGNPYMLSLADLVADGLLDPQDLAGGAELRDDRVAFRAVAAHRKPLFAKLAQRVPAADRGLLSYAEREAGWLDDHALFCALLDAYGQDTWAGWPPAVRHRDPAALAAARIELAPAIHKHRVLQYLFARQWAALRAYARERGVALVGDIPIYVNYNSADVWAHPEYFQLDRELRPRFEAGVPADGFFSDQAQHWGNPLYDWPRLAEDGYRWWGARLRHALELYDHVRMDHFRGFQAYWAVPAGQDAATGAWVPGPGRALFDALRSQLGGLPIFVEDLGLITEDVHQLRREVGVPAMSVFQFGFTRGGDSPYLPHHAGPHVVYYTGTHDVPPLAEWRERLSPEELARVLAYLGVPDGAALPVRDFVWNVVRCAWATSSPWVVAQLQDLLASGAESQMNRPGLADLANWSWRVQAHELSDALAARCARLNAIYGRGRPAAG